MYAPSNNPRDAALDAAAWKTRRSPWPAPTEILAPHDRRGRLTAALVGGVLYASRLLGALSSGSSDSPPPPPAVAPPPARPPPIAASVRPAGWWDRGWVRALVVAALVVLLAVGVLVASGAARGIIAAITRPLVARGTGRARVAAAAWRSGSTSARAARWPGHRAARGRAPGGAPRPGRPIGRGPALPGQAAPRSPAGATVAALRGAAIHWTATSPATHQGDRYTLSLTNGASAQRVTVVTITHGPPGPGQYSLLVQTLNLAPRETQTLSADNTYGRLTTSPPALVRILKIWRSTSPSPTRRAQSPATTSAHSDGASAGAGGSGPRSGSHPRSKRRPAFEPAHAPGGADATRDFSVPDHPDRRRHARAAAGPADADAVIAPRTPPPSGDARDRCALAATQRSRHRARSRARGAVQRADPAR